MTNEPNQPAEQIPYFEDEESKLKPELPIEERDMVHVIVYNRATDEVICLDWEKFGWKSFILGGMEAGENPIDAALREVKEETGYKNLKYIAEAGKTRSGYFAAHKQVNRISNATGLQFELIDTEQDPVDEAEVTNHIMKWIPRAEVADYINLSSQKYIWERTVDILKNK